MIRIGLCRRSCIGARYRNMARSGNCVTGLIMGKYRRIVRAALSAFLRKDEHERQRQKRLLAF
jgi:hypothetical protein